MPVTLRVHIAEKRSPAQYETISVGADIQAESLEIHELDDIHRKLRELQDVAQLAVQQQLGELMPAPVSRSGSPTSRPALGNGPKPRERSSRPAGPAREPTAKQRTLLSRIARDRHLGPESIREIAERIVGKRVEEMDRRDMSQLLETLIEGEAAQRAVHA